MTVRLRSGLKLAAIFLAALGTIYLPGMAAHLVYQHPHAFGLKQINHGELVAVNADMGHLQFQQQGKMMALSQYSKKWLMVYFAQDGCEDHCIDRIFYLHQIRIALGKNQQRLETLLILPKDVHTHGQAIIDSLHYGDVGQVTANEAQQQALMRILKQADPGTEAWHHNQLFLLDPNSRIVLRYQQGTQPKAIYQDLKRLLEVSQIG